MNYKLYSRIASLVLFSIPVCLPAQIVSPRSTNVKMDELMEKGTIVADVLYDNVKGSPYLNAEFLPGTLSMKNGRIFDEIVFRYNIYTDQIEFKRNDEILMFSAPNEVEKVVFESRTFEYGNYYLKNKLVNGYYQLLADGECKLLVRRSSIIKREELPASEFGGHNYRDYFRNEVDHYITKNHRDLIPINKTTKSLVKVLSDKGPEIKKFIAESNLDLKKDEDLGEIVFYYNEIKKGK
jgi:hypothetical protein